MSIQVVVQLSEIAGNIVCPQDTKRQSEIFHLEVGRWVDLENIDLLRPHLEKLIGKKLLSFEVGDACEYGPFLTCYFAGGDVVNINVFAVDSWNGEHIFGRERTD